MIQLTPVEQLLKARAHQPELVNVPARQFIMIDGQGDPNTSQSYKEALEALYAVSYRLKFALKKTGLDFKVAALEGLWWAKDMSKFVGRKQDWYWTMMIAQPSSVTNAHFAAALEEVKRKKNPVALEKLRLETLTEGPAAQVLYLGPYSAEGPTISQLHAFIHEQGFEFDGLKNKHHEIYLGDPRRSAPEKLKTIIRQPFKA